MAAAAIMLGADLFMGAERRCRQALQRRLQPGLPDDGALGDRRPAGVRLVPLSRHRLFDRDGTLPAGIAVPACCSASSSLCIFVGLEYTTVARSTLLVNTMPFWMLIGAHFLLGERMSLAQVRRPAAGLLPAWSLVFSDKLSLPGPSAIFGDVLSIGAGLFWAATTLVIKRTQAGRGQRRKAAALPARRSRRCGTAGAAVRRTGVPRP